MASFSGVQRAGGEGTQQRQREDCRFAEEGRVREEGQCSVGRRIGGTVQGEGKAEEGRGEWRGGAAAVWGKGKKKEIRVGLLKRVQSKTQKSQTLINNI